MKKVASDEWRVGSDASGVASDRGVAQGPRVLLLGIGNLLWADEGFGVRCVEAMAAHYRFGPSVTLLDGGTQGIYLVDQVRAAEVLVVFDAVDYGLPPGTLKRVEGDEVPQFLGAKKMSLHQTGFQEVLALADLLGNAPRHLLLIGVQPVELDDFGGSLRPEVKAAVGPAIDLALAYLAAHGVRPLEETALAAGVCAAVDAVAAKVAGIAKDPAGAATAHRRIETGARTSVTALCPDAVPDARADLPHPALDLVAYELGRPPPELACRTGDERVLAMGAADPSPTDSAEPGAHAPDGPGADRRDGPNTGANPGPRSGSRPAPQTSARMTQ